MNECSSMSRVLMIEESVEGASTLDDDDVTEGEELLFGISFKNIQNMKEETQPNTTLTPTQLITKQSMERILPPSAPSPCLIQGSECQINTTSPKISTPTGSPPPIKVLTTPLKGRCIVSKASLPKGTIVFIESPSLKSQSGKGCELCGKGAYDLTTDTGGIGCMREGVRDGEGSICRRCRFCSVECRDKMGRCRWGGWRIEVMKILGEGVEIYR
jgi:hypothetical protein